MKPDMIVAYTMRDLTTLACPLCSHTEDAPRVPVSDALGAAFGISGDTLARVHADQYRLLGGDPAGSPAAIIQNRRLCELPPPDPADPMDLRVPPFERVSRISFDEDPRGLLDLCTNEPDCASPMHVSTCPEARR